MKKYNREYIVENMRAVFMILYSLFLIFYLSGCSLPESREIEGLELLRTMGVDETPDGVRVTVAAGPSGSADQGGEKPAVRSRAAGSISAACLGLQGEGDARLFYGHVGHLLIGEELAGLGIGEALGYVERDIEMRLDTAVYVVRGATAAAAMEGAGGGVADRLEALAEDAGLAPVSLPRSAKEILESEERSGAALVPALVPAPNGDGERDLRSDGYAILKGGALAGWAEGDAALGVGLLLGGTNTDILELETEAGTAALRIVGSGAKICPVFEGNTLMGLEVNCAIEANVAEAPPGLDQDGGEALAELCTALEAACETRVRAAVDLSQALDADYLGLGMKAGLASPWHWARIQDQWRGGFAALPIYIKVEGNIQRGYDMK